MKHLNLTLLFSSIVFAAYSSFTEHSYIIPSLLFIGSLGMFLYEKTLKSFEYKEVSQEFSRLKDSFNEIINYRIDSTNKELRDLNKFVLDSYNDLHNKLKLVNDDFENRLNLLESRKDLIFANLAELDQKIERTKQSADLAAKTLINRPQRNTI